MSLCLYVIVCVVVFLFFVCCVCVICSVCCLFKCLCLRLSVFAVGACGVHVCCALSRVFVLLRMGCCVHVLFCDCFVSCMIVVCRMCVCFSCVVCVFVLFLIVYLCFC